MQGARIGEFRTLKLGHGLGLAEELNRSIGLSDGAKGLEEASKTTDSEKAKLGAGVSQACSESKSNLAAKPLTIQRIDQFPDGGGCCRRGFVVRRRFGGGIRRDSVGPQWLLQIHLRLGRVVAGGRVRQ